jgi:hypothetical protein
MTGGTGFRHNLLAAPPLACPQEFFGAIAVPISH